ncbi:MULTISPECIES: TrmH family RNA methyltransferase [Methylobacterium]|uniref:23S rRNA (Guanosine-2'-O-)-methyltransferase RlmB n=2 Tax=Methylobacterium TaxID=407 RepID=A0A679JEQ3_9HYPH|nr:MULTISPECIES: RNA methyltransferase [Methylobacterium]KQO41529.1 RNA methyltransferase [Methylobacterium sp. Leaf85]MBD8904765.1 RNA methyltransferase [Methylobacterium bullatum]GJD39578.1 23S rRNA (guanosine-2'-O-)-methyltransferase RlmB [Methylobacterium bullatum]CAA2106160.1 putative tRNA/rRNA methyltransferase [Methylobacterium bullatum]
MRPPVTPIPIDDPADPRIAAYAAMRERDLVGREGRFIVEGEVTLRVLLSGAARFAPESLLLSHERVAPLSDALAALPGSVPVYTASKAVMSAIAGFPIHRGVMAVGVRGAEPPLALPPPPAPALVAGLVGLTNHDNVGGLFRNAAAFGADGVLLDPATCDPLYRKAIRVSAGAALTVPFARLDAEAMLGFAHANALVPLAFSPRGDDVLAELPPLPRTLLLLGTEGPGLSHGLMARIRTVRIPMAAGFDSLNVATAGALALHHLAMQRPSCGHATIRGNCPAPAAGRD